MFKKFDKPALDVSGMRLIGRLRNNWRQRMVLVYELSGQPDLVYSVGHPFDGSEAVAVVEERKDYARVIDQFPVTAVYN